MFRMTLQGLQPAREARSDGRGDSARDVRPRASLCQPPPQSLAALPRVVLFSRGHYEYAPSHTHQHVNLRHPAPRLAMITRSAIARCSPSCRPAARERREQGEETEDE